jgi:16S rRNA (cytidine1402-2'-O)-methyltransferase
MQTEQRYGHLFLVPTPIGNLSDITQRALEVLSQVDIIACEDTRNSGNLLKHFNISKRLVSYHNFNESSRAAQLIENIRAGQSVAVITDGGSPGISDPAYRVVRAALEAGITIVPLPGPTAIIPALTASGLATDRFFFEGFLPQKAGARIRRITELSTLPHTLVFYESPYRVHKSLDALYEVLGDRQACLAREITKKFEEFIRGPLSEMRNKIKDRTIKGEVVIIVSGVPAEADADNLEEDDPE